MKRASLGLAMVAAFCLVGCDQKPKGSPFRNGTAAIDTVGMTRGGQEYLWSRQQADGSWADVADTFPGGTTAIVTWAMLESGVKTTEPRLAKSLDYLQKLQTDKTYTVSLRANVYKAAARQDARYEALLKQDVERLYKSSMEGAYTYVLPAIRDIRDQSNSHYAVLGVEAGLGRVDIPKEYWQQVMKYWIAAQNQDGGWPYSHRGSPSTVTMTAAAVGSLQTCRTQLNDPLIDAPVRRGLAYLDKEFAESLKDPTFMYYYFLAIQRVGWQTDRKEFGNRNWQQSVLTELSNRRKANNSWDGPWGSDVSTAYALLVMNRTLK